MENILIQHRVKNIFLVTGKDSYEKCGAKKVIESILSGYKVIHFNDFEVSPKLKDIEKGIEIYKENNCDFVIAVGGGSVMDVAKAVRIFSANSGKPIGYVTGKNKVENKGVPLVAIPTTSGSGSEATKFIVIYVDKTKYSLESDIIKPEKKFKKMYDDMIILYRKYEEYILNDGENPEHYRMKFIERHFKSS